MSAKKKILLVVACVSGFVFFFITKHVYVSKLSILKQEAKVTFIQALNQELKNEKIEGPFSFYLENKILFAQDMPDSVYLEDESGRYWLKLNKEKHHKNIADDTSIRFLHSIAFKKKTIVPDSLNTLWRKYLYQSGVSTETAICISVTDKFGETKSQWTTSRYDWCNMSTMIDAVYIGYVCEIEIIAYLHHSIWSMMYIEFVLILLIYILCVYIIYRSILFVQNRIASIRKNRIIEVPVVKIVRGIDDSCIRSYALRDNFIFYAEQNRIEYTNGEKYLQPQAAQLLELFLSMKANGYILSNEIICEKLWSDGSGTRDRIHKAIARLRSNIRELDSSIDIIRCVGGYQLVL